MRKYLFVLLAVCIMLCSSACNAPSPTTEADEVATISSFYSISANEDMTYSYRIIDKNGKVLFSDDHSPREPQIEQVSRDVYGVTIQTGTGLSTNWAVYCDVENSKVSETFQYVLMAQGNYVVYANYENGEHSIIVQDIFDQSAYYQKQILENCSPVAGDVVVAARPNGDGVAVVTYLIGDDYKETELIIIFP